MLLIPESNKKKHDSKEYTRDLASHHRARTDERMVFWQYSDIRTGGREYFIQQYLKRYLETGII